GKRRSGLGADPEQAEVVIVGGCGRAQKGCLAAHLHDDVEAQDVPVEGDTARDVADVQHGVVEAVDSHRVSFFRGSTRSYRNTVERSTMYARRVTRWLSADEQVAWRAYVESSKVLFDALDRQLQRDSEMPHAYYEILVALSEADGRAMRMSELAERTLSSRS